MSHSHIRGARSLLLSTLLVLLLSPVRAERLSDPASIAATSQDWVVTYQQLDQRALAQGSAQFRGLRLQEAIYEARKAALDVLIADHLLGLEAKRTGVSPQALLDRELRSRAAAITENDVRVWYEANRLRVNAVSFEAAAADIRRLLEAQQRERLRQDLLLRLRAATPVTVLLQPPREQLQVSADEPASGPAGAPVEIVMYSDFQCPFCAKVGGTIERLKQKYADRIRVVFRDFPLTSLHPQAEQAAIAARCAHEQGRFWEFHDRLFAHQRDVTPARLEEYATLVGLDLERFAACRANPRTQTIVTANRASGERLGITGTPAFFINGRFVTGAQPDEVFQRVIDEELQARAVVNAVASESTRR